MLHYMSMKLGRASSIREVYRQKDVQQGGCFILFIGVVYAVLMSENSDLDLCCSVSMSGTIDPVLSSFV